MKLRTYIFLLMVWLVCMYAASSCSTVDTQEEPEFNPSCTTRIELRNGTKFEAPEDVDGMVNAEQGCVRHYGEKSCLVRFIKTGKKSYYAICKRNK